MFGDGQVCADSSPYGSACPGWGGAHTATVSVRGLARSLSPAQARELASLLNDAASAAEEMRQINEARARRALAEKRP